MTMSIERSSLHKNENKKYNKLKYWKPPHAAAATTANYDPPC